MKYPLLTILFFLCTCISTNAQFEPYNAHSNEIMIGYGVLPTFQLSDAYYASPYKDEYYSGAYFITYKHHFTKKVSVSFTVVYENETGIMRNYPNSFFKRRCFTFSPEVSYYYSNKSGSALQFYCTGGIAYSLRNEIHIFDSAFYYQISNYQNGHNIYGSNVQTVNNTDQLNIYISPIGIHFGRTFGGFLEIGVGYKGIINGGLFYEL